MKYHIHWQTQFGTWQKYTTKHNEADAFRVMRRRVATTGKRHKLTDGNGNLIDLLN